MREINAIAQTIDSKDNLLDALRTAGRAYRETPEKKSGFFHGKDGLNRAIYLENLEQQDLVSLFAVLYAVMCPRGFFNCFESRSSALAQTLAQLIIRGSYISTYGCGDHIDSDNLESTVLHNNVLQDSKANPSASRHYNLGGAGSTIYDKEDGLRVILEQTRKKMSVIDQKYFDDKVSLFKKTLVKEQSGDQPMRSFGNESVTSETDAVCGSTYRLHEV